MAIDSVNLANSVKDVKTQIQKPAFGQSVPQKQVGEVLRKVKNYVKSDEGQFDIITDILTVLLA